MTALFELRDCQLRYPSARKGRPDKLALFVERLVIHPGERVALLGRSGSGKSTLLRHLRKLQTDSTSWCPQQASLVSQLTAFHNIYSGALDRHSGLINLKNLLLPSARFKAEIAELAEPLGIAELLWRKADELSGGQQQRVAVARCLYQQKPVLLADEPVSALDKLQGRDILSHLVAQHATSIIALHDAAMALHVCDRVIGLKDRAVLLDCPASEVDARAVERLYQ